MTRELDLFEKEDLICIELKKLEMRSRRTFRQEKEILRLRRELAGIETKIDRFSCL